MSPLWQIVTAGVVITALMVLRTLTEQRSTDNPTPHARSPEACEEAGCSALCGPDLREPETFSSARKAQL